MTDQTSSLYDGSQVTKVRLWRPIQALFIFTAVIAGVPSWFAWVAFVLNPADMAENAAGMVFAVVIGIIALIVVRGCWRIGGDSTERLISIRGVLRKVEVSPLDLTMVHEVDFLSNGERVRQISLADHRDEIIGVVPKSVLLTRRWDEFLRHLHNVAEKSRQDRRVRAEMELYHKPVEQWTVEDIKGYESREDDGY